MKQKIGSWAFLIGVIIAIVLGVLKTQVASISGALQWLLVAIGLIVGFLNVTDREVKDYLMAGAVLVIVSALGGSMMSSMPMVQGVLAALNMLFVPSTIIVAVKSVFSMARS